ncbi:formate/nitrite transporter family protein [Rhizosaccharibacter radicis]|uniref:Formate/nitrite transporter family protein n=1 Tax=Rhizosaccharibacter radicis TaxID=2782605 RepID=A0ABT1VZ73_9PROT|nr:formate/nitrite transporter family protein [Acetobacteraceae bacterium KSS12]
MSDYNKPAATVAAMIDAAVIKNRLPALDLLVRGALAGAYLGFVTSMAFLVAAQTGQLIVGALLFPAGFALIVVLGLELLTGNFGIMPVGLFARRIPLGGLLRNWVLVFAGNLIGSLIYASLFWVAATSCGHTTGAAIGDKLRALAVSKTSYYQALGWAGLATVFVKAILCNWMVSLGSVMGLASNSVPGKILGAWLPIFVFVEQGFEHSVVNMFAIPVGMMLGAPVSVGQWWLWNQIPVTLGNMVGAVIFTGGALFLTYSRIAASEQTPTVGRG